MAQTNESLDSPNYNDTLKIRYGMEFKFIANIYLELKYLKLDKLSLKVN